MDRQYDEFGVDSLHAALIEDTELKYIAEKPEYFAPSAEITNEPEIEVSQHITITFRLIIIFQRCYKSNNDHIGRAC